MDILPTVGTDEQSQFRQNVAIRALSGAFTDGRVREVLRANLSLFVNGSTGSDTNNGKSSTTAFATIQKAVNTVADNYDLGGFNVSISVAAGTYTGAVTLRPFVGRGVVTITGDTTTPSNVTISVTSNNAITAFRIGFGWVLSGLKFTTATSGHCIEARFVSFITVNSCEFGDVAAGYSHMVCYDIAVISVGTNYRVSGGGGLSHIYAQRGANIQTNNVTVTITNTPAFSFWAIAQTTGVLTVNGMTFSGSATGARYLVESAGIIYTATGSVTYLPGNAAGTEVPPGKYL